MFFLLPFYSVFLKVFPSVDVMLEPKKNGCHQGSTSRPRGSVPMLIVVKCEDHSAIQGHKISDVHLQKEVYYQTYISCFIKYHDTNILPEMPKILKTFDSLQFGSCQRTLTYFMRGSITIGRADLLFDWFRLDQTCKSVSNSI